MKNKDLTVGEAAGAGRNIARRWPRGGIAARLVLGFGALTILVFALAVANFAILAKVTKVSESLLAAETPLLNALDRMLEDIHEQEFYARRAALLGSTEMLRVSHEEVAEFRSLLATIATIPESSWLPLRRLGALHDLFAALLEPGPVQQDARAEERLHTVHQELTGLIKSVAQEAHNRQQRKIARITLLGERAFELMAAACAAALLLSAVATYLLTRSIARPIDRLKAATERIAAGRFDEVPDVRRGDELGDLSQAFSKMAWRLKRLEELSLDANPLTRLPGNIAIEAEVANRLERGSPFVFCLADLDNFKAFNDYYGYARGSDLIKATARLVRQVVLDHGSPEDFVGHIGGDDFVVVTEPERYRGICDAVIAGFDAMAGGHYDPEDLRRRYLVTKSRKGREEHFPIITISIAAVDSRKHKIENPLRIGEIAADLKEYAKSLDGSVFVVDRRRREAAQGGAGGDAQQTFEIVERPP